MLRLDLDAAGIPYVVDGPDGPLYADFHALRHSFVRLLDQSGATLKQAMQLARHSDPKLTMRRYGRAQLHDLAGAVEKTPALILQPAPKAARATGTENVRRMDMATCSSRLVRALHNPLPGDAKTCGSMQVPTPSVKPACHTPLTAEKTGFASSCGEMRMHERDYARRDSNPQPSVPKTDALSS
jgi:hypothetical protein